MESGLASTKHRDGYHHGNLREAMILAGLKILERDGLAGLGMRAAAREAGVSQTAPYHHFEGKQGLLAAVAARGFARLQAEQDAIASNTDLDPEARVRELGVGYVRMARRYPEIFKLMFGPTIEHRESYPDLAEAYQAAYGVIEDAVRTLLTARQGNVEPADVTIGVTAAWATVHGLATLLIDGRLRPGEGPIPDEDVLIRSVLHTVTFGVGRLDEMAKP
jgi:AcrR family transcriptional regulator